MSKMHYILYIIASSSIFAFLIFVLDKIFAKFSFWRIPERVLLLSSFFGGAAGALAAMYLVRHKTRKRKFAIGVPVMLLLHLILIAALHFR